MNFFKNNYQGISSSINLRNLIVCLIIVGAVFFFDRISKIKIIDHQIKNGAVYINDFINFELIWNTGIGFGLLSSNSTVFYNSISIIIGLISFVIILIILRSNFYEKVIYSLILGGALGNLYDRITFYAVPDFIDIHYKKFHWFTFNIADIFITIGILLLIFVELFKNEKD